MGLELSRHSKCLAPGLTILFGVFCYSCKPKSSDNKNGDSGTLMVLTSSPECIAALKSPSSIEKLSPYSAEDIASAMEVCAATAPNSGFAGYKDSSGKALCVGAASAAGFKDLEQFAKWSALGSVPIMMSCSSFQKGGGNHYGRKVNKQVYRTFLRALIEEDMKAPSVSHACTFAGNSRDLDFLLGVNSSLPLTHDINMAGKSRDERLDIYDSKFEARGAKGTFRSGDVFQAIPMSPTEVTFLEKEWADKTMVIQKIDKPFMSFDVTPPAMVSGSFAVHTPKALLCNRLSTWQTDALKLDALKSQPKAYSTSVAALTRRCIAIHPFGDGNGRSCGLWAVHALARAKVPPSVRWPHEDYSVSLVDYTKQFLAGIENAKSMKAKP